MMDVEHKCPKCGEGKMSPPRFNRYEDCLNRTCTVCCYVSYEATYENQRFNYETLQRLSGEGKC